MYNNLEDLNEKWKKLDYFAAGFGASQLCKLVTGSPIENHLEAEMYHDGDRNKSFKDQGKAVAISSLVGALFGGGTAYLANSKKGIIEGSLTGALVSATITFLQMEAQKT